MLKRKILFLFIILQINNFVFSYNEKGMPDPELNGRNKYLHNKVKQFGLIAGFFACGCAASLVSYLLKCTQTDISNNGLCLSSKTIAILSGGLSASFCLGAISAICKLRYENNPRSKLGQIARHL